jgi:hypothetical protein
MEKVEEPEPAYPILHEFCLVETEKPIDLSVSYAQPPMMTPKMVYF